MRIKLRTAKGKLFENKRLSYRSYRVDNADIYILYFVLTHITKEGTLNQEKLYT